MSRNYPFIATLGVVLLVFFSSCFSYQPIQNSPDFQVHFTMISPDGLLKAEISSSDQFCGYRLLNQNKEIIKWSSFGLETAEASLPLEAKLKESRQYESEDQYQLVHGKSSQSDYSAKGLALEYSLGETLFTSLFQLSNESLAIRYQLKAPGEIKILGERTEYHFPDQTTSWAQKMSFLPSYERIYSRFDVDSMKKAKQGFALPQLFKSEENYILIAESGMNKSYCVTRLQKADKLPIFFNAYSHSTETTHSGSIYPCSQKQMETTWKIILTGSLSTLIESNIVSDLALPQEEVFNETGTDYIQPGLSAWDWLNDSETDGPDIQKIYIEKAAEYGLEYVLIDANWNKWNNNNPEPIIKELVTFANSKNIGILLWYNSGGKHNGVTEEPRNKMDNHDIRAKEMKWLNKMGVKGIKVDFFRSDKQQRVAQYIEILEAAAKEKIMVNFHGCTVPRGLSRTWPNLVTVEAVRGGENFRKGVDSLQKMESMLFCFTRNIVGPMDYTPFFIDPRFVMNGNDYSYALAQMVLYESAINHLAGSMEFPNEGYPAFFKKQPKVKELLSSMPAAWNETLFIEGNPDSHIVLARRKGSSWYIAGINGGDKRVSISAEGIIKAIESRSSFKAASDQMWFLPGEDDFSIIETESAETIILASGEGFTAVIQ